MKSKNTEDGCSRCGQSVLGDDAAILSQQTIVCTSCVRALLALEQYGDRLSFAETGCVAFWNAVQQTTRPQFLSAFSPYEYSRMRCVLRRDGQAGYAITSDGEIVSLFSVGEPGAGRQALADAIERGGVHLNAFAGFLTRYYERAGFVETGRVAFDPAQAPAGWNTERDGRPDVVFMRLQDGAAVAQSA
jgi:hypothetical protein